MDASPENARLIRQARLVNDAKPQYVIDKVKSALFGVKNPVVACLGLAFKANIDDLRESPAVSICEQLAANPLTLKAVEPHISELPASLSSLDNVELVDAEDAVAAAHVVLLLVDHKVFAGLPETVSMKGKTVIDTRGQWRSKQAPT